MIPESTLRAWMRSIAAGDAAALRRLYDATSAALYGLVLAVLDTRDGADEVLAETYVQVWRRAPRYDPAKGGVRTWLAAIARHRAIDRLRARRRAPAELAAAAELDEIVAPGPTPLQQSLAGEAEDDVRGALARLSDNQRRAVVAVFFEGLSHSEAAAALGEPLGTLKGRMRAALGALRRALAIHEEGAV